MAPYEEKGKIIEFLNCLANNNIFVFIFLFISALFLAILAWFFLPVYFSLGIIVIIAIGLAVFISYRKDISIPIIEVILKREYYRVKFKCNREEEKLIFVRLYLKFLYGLILLFKNSEDSFGLLKDDIFIKLDELLKIGRAHV